MSNNTNYTTAPPPDYNEDMENFNIIWNYLYIVIFIICYDMMIKQYIKSYVRKELNKYEEERFSEISTIRRSQADV